MIQVHIWSEKEERSLITCYKERLDDFNSTKSHDVIWGGILKVLNSEGIKVTLLQLKNKWKNMKKTYKKIIDHNNHTGNDRATWKYLDEFNELFGTKASTKAAVVYDSGKKEKLVKDTACSESSSSESCHNEIRREGLTEERKKTKKRAYNKSPSLSDIIESVQSSNESLREEIHAQHEAKMQRFDRLLDLFEKKMNNN